MNGSVGNFGIPPPPKFSFSAASLALGSKLGSFGSIALAGGGGVVAFGLFRFFFFGFFFFLAGFDGLGFGG